MMYLYIVRCRDDSYYTGITPDLHRRLNVHNVGKGAKYTRARRPVRLVYFEEHDSDSSARKREAEIKKWPRCKKAALVDSFPARRLTRIMTSLA